MGEYSDVTQPERLIFILMLLSENSHPFSIAQIHEKVCAYGANVDERTIRRDIDLLSEIAYITE
ncbi:MAG: HTH domain-containing protein, partial [Lachnospiraceae bacterium]|nr:HTH domain-containing protein [Lachnospiraceae bacterium]